MKKILVADDNFDEVDLLIEMLSESYEVVHVKDGRKALEELKQKQYDGAILDLDMVPDGVNLALGGRYQGDIVSAEARRINQEMPLVLRSRTIDDNLIERMKPLDVFCHSKLDKNGDAPIIEYLQEKLVD